MSIRRLKTYTGSQGYVYQYYFVGRRPAQTREATEFIFDVTSDRKTRYSVSVLLPREVVALWAESHGRTLSDAEQYAAVKLRLFRAFDEIEDMQSEGRDLSVNSESLNSSLSSLGID